MPFYNLHELDKKSGKINPKIESAAVVGEYMKFGIVQKAEGEGPPLHEHPNEEQFTVIIEGEMHFVLGDEDRVVGPSTLVHIPRNTRHRSRPVNGPATFLTVKSPAGDGNLDQDYQRVRKRRKSRPSILARHASAKQRSANVPFYTIKELDQTGGRGAGTDIDVTSAGVPGEFMKFGIVHKPEGKGSKLHEHPNEEQFTVIISGEMHFVLGDEDRVVGPGTLVHIPRNVRHRSRAVNGPSTFFTVKSPAHDGNLHKDRIVHSEAETAKVEALYPGNK